MARNNGPVILLAVLLGLIGWWCWQNLEWRPEPGEERWSNAAQLDPFLAAEQYLKEVGLGSESSDKLDQLERLAAYDMIVINEPGRLLTPRRAGILLDWLRRGGHLVIAAPLYDETQPDSLLTAFGVQKYKSDYRRDAEADKADAPAIEKLSEALRKYNERLNNESLNDVEAETETEAEAVPPEELVELDFDGEPRPLLANFGTVYHLFHPVMQEDETTEEAAAPDAPAPKPFYWDGNVAGTQIMQFDFGEGLLTVVTDARLWRNEAIGEYDHAYLLETLAPADGAVLWLRGAESPYITALLWRNGREAILAGFVLLLCWLWYRARRFGPLMTPLGTERRSLAEHLLAAATYHWQRRDAATLLQPVRDELERRAQRFFPGYQQLEPVARCALLAEHSGIDQRAVAHALTDPPASQAEALRIQIATLQTLRQRL